MRLIGKDRVLALFDQGVQDGTPTTPGTAVVNPDAVGCNALAKRIRYSCRATTTDVHCPADGTKCLRFLYATQSVDVDMAVGSGGRTILTLGHYYAASCKALSTLVSPLFTFTGLLTKDSWQGGGDGPQSQSITIAGPAEVN